MPAEGSHEEDPVRHAENRKLIWRLTVLLGELREEIHTQARTSGSANGSQIIAAGLRLAAARAAAAPVAVDPTAEAGSQSS